MEFKGMKRVLKSMGAHKKASSLIFKGETG